MIAMATLIGRVACATLRGTRQESNVARMSAQAAGQIPLFTQADRLRKAREHAGLEQGELAELMGVSRGTVSNNEKGKVAARRIVIRAWALATGVDAAWLETGTSADLGGPGGESVQSTD